MGDKTSSGVVNASFSDEKSVGDPPISTIASSINLAANKQVTTAVPEPKKKLKDLAKFCSVKKELVPLKIVLFCWYGAFSSLLPYMTIYLKHLGITAKETAFIYTFFPFAKLLGPAIGGLIADKLGRYKPVLYVSLVFDIIFATSFLYIPPIPEKTCTTFAQLSCVRDSPAEIIIKNCCGENFCESFNGITNLQLNSCKLTCNEVYSNETESYSICLATNEIEECVQSNETLDQLNVKHKSQELDSCLYSITPKNYSGESSCYALQRSQNCSIYCNITLTNLKEKVQCEVEWNERFPTLAITFVIFIGFQVFVAICFALIEATTLAMVKEHKDDYGRQRFWAILSTAVFSPLTGYLVGVASKKSGYDNYSPAFYLFDALIVSNIIMLYILDLSVAPPAKKIIKNVTHLLRMPEVMVFLIVVFFLGTFWGFLESFLFWHLLELKSPPYLLGLTLTVGAIVGLPFLYTSDWFVIKCGRVNLLIIAFMFYSIRCVGYSYIYNPWWFVLFEAMEASTYHLMWVAAATYAASLAPRGLLATIQGCVAGLHYGIGRGSGSLIGGNLISVFGNRIAFRSLGVAAGIIGVVYAFIYIVFIRKKNKNNSDKTVPKDNVSGVEKQTSGTNKESSNITSSL